MRIMPFVLALAACKSSGDSPTGDDDGAPGDTEVPDDTDAATNDSDTDATAEDFCAFTQCGADVVGVWNVIGACIGVGPAYEYGCPTATTDVDIDVSGTWTFDAGGTYTLDGHAAYTIIGTFPAECNAGLTDCSSWSTPFPGTTCTGDVAVQCTCTSIEFAFPMVEVGSWMYTGEDLTTLEDGPAGYPRTYATCQDGVRLDLNLTVPNELLRFTLEQ